MKKQSTITKCFLFGRHLTILGQVEIHSNSYTFQNLNITDFEERFEVLEILDGENPDYDISDEFETKQIYAICEYARKNHTLITKAGVLINFQFSDN